MKIREILKSDLIHIVPLAAQLGYACTHDQLSDRFQDLVSDHSGVILIGELENGSIVAFAQLNESTTLLTGHRAELNAIVVDKSVRGSGFGKQMILAAEEWARSRGLEKIRLGSRTSRTDAHEFYKKMGFEIDKTWFVFVKQI